MPIYYATGSKPMAFFWASLSGMTELIGAALGWVVLRKVFNQLVYGILFGLISGMMVRAWWGGRGGGCTRQAARAPCVPVGGVPCNRVAVCGSLASDCLGTVRSPQNACVSPASVARRCGFVWTQVYIALKELLPTAHLYDPEDKVVTISLVGGMVVMAASLVLFLF